MKVYIAGAITNNPTFKEQFEAAEERLKTDGHEVINPAKNQGYTYREYINIGLFELMHCEAIYMLSGWEKSTGARLEHEYAKAVGLTIWYQMKNTIHYYCPVCGNEVGANDEYCHFCGVTYVKEVKST